MSNYLGVRTDDALPKNSGAVGNFTIGGLLFESASVGLTASVTRTQAGATQLITEVSRVDTSTAPAAGSTLGDGVVLMASVAGLDACVINNTANIIVVYPLANDQINGLGAGVGCPVPPGDVAQFECAAIGDWRFEAGVGASGRFELLLSVPGITAGTTRTQAGATLLQAEFNRVDTSTAPAVGTTLGDGIILPPGINGIDLEVVNNTVNIVMMYANGTDTINGVAGASGVPLAPGAIETFFCVGAGSWFFDAGIGTSGPYDTVLACDAVIATGTTQATSFQLTAILNKINTATALQGIRLPASAAGLDVIVENHTGFPIVVYGFGTDVIDDVPTATGLQQMDSSVVIFTCYAPGKWYTNGAASGYAKNAQGGVVLQTIQFSDGLTAAGTTQATGFQMQSAINTVSTVGVGAGVNLPASSPGLQIVVQNNGTSALLVYPAQGAADTINGLPATAGLSLLPGSAITFNCTAAGAWTGQTGSTHNAAVNTSTSAVSFTASGALVTGGVSTVDLQLTGTLTAAATITMPSIASLTTALHSPNVGTSYRLRMINQSSGAFAWTVAVPAGYTATGTQTIAQGTWREFVVTLTTLSSVSFVSVATGTWS